MLVLAAGPEEALHRGAAVGAFDPFIGGAELEFCQLGLAGHEVDGVEQRRRIDAVERRAG